MENKDFDIAIGYCLKSDDNKSSYHSYHCQLSTMSQICAKCFMCNILYKPHIYQYLHFAYEETEAHRIGNLL